MTFDIDMIRKVYERYPERIAAAREAVGKPLTLSEKILYAHLWDGAANQAFDRGASYVDFAPDRVAMQDATAQMALLQFMQAGKDKVAVPSTAHADHLIQARIGADKDLQDGINKNNEVFNFLSSVCNKYGIGFWKPGAGIIHQVVLARLQLALAQRLQHQKAYEIAVQEQALIGVSDKTTRCCRTTLLHFFVNPHAQSQFIALALNTFAEVWHRRSLLRLF